MQGNDGQKEHPINAPALLGYCLSHGFNAEDMSQGGWRGDGEGSEMTIAGGWGGPRGGRAGAVVTIGYRGLMPVTAGFEDLIFGAPRMLCPRGEVENLTLLEVFASGFAGA